MMSKKKVIERRLLGILLMMVVVLLLNIFTSSRTVLVNEPSQTLLLYITDIFFLIIILEQFYKIVRIIQTNETNKVGNRPIVQEIELNNKIFPVSYSESANYLEKLISQKVSQRNTFLILVFWFFGFFIAIFASFYSKNAILSINFFAIFFEFFFMFGSLLTIVLIPFYYINKSLYLNKYNDLLEAFKTGKMKELTVMIQELEKRQDIRISGQKYDYSLLNYLKVFPLLVGKEFDSALKNLLTLDKTTVRFFAFKFEYKNLIGDCYRNLGDIERAKQYYQESITGFEKFNISYPIPLIEKKLHQLS